MIEQIPKHNGPAKVVTDFELPDLTSNGWRIVAILQEDSVEMQNDQVPDSRPEAVYGQTLLVTRYHPCTRTRFLITQDSDCALGDAIKDKAAAEAVQRQAEKDLAETEKVRADTQVKLVQRMDEIENLHNRLNALHKRAGEEDARKHQMERDMAKLRKHFGEKAMSDALAED